MNAKTRTRPTRRRVKGSGGTNEILPALKARPQDAAATIGWLLAIICAVCAVNDFPTWAIFDSGLFAALSFGTCIGIEIERKL